jgi:hypothetical protein
MTDRINEIPTTVELCYDGQVIGRISDVFFSDETWFGSFHASPEGGENKLVERITRFIDFCQDWNYRVESNPNDPPDASEFEKYSDVLKSGLWCVKSPQGNVWQITEAPVFSRNGEVSWRTD